MRNGSRTRRDVLIGGACGLAAGGLWALEEGEELVALSGYAPGYRVDVQPKNPRLKSFDLRRLTSWKTPESEFYEFHQGSAPAVDGRAWRLRIGGAVDRSAEFSLQDLQRRPDQQETAVTLECSGNSGTPQLMNGLVGNAVWTGISLVSILKECGLKPEAREVVFLGLDSEKERKWQTGNQEYTSPYGRSIFVQDALDPRPMLALKMNGEPLFSRTRVSSASHPAGLVRNGACEVAQSHRSSGPPLRRASDGAELSEPVGSRHTGGRYLAGYVDLEDAPEIGHRQGDAQAGRKSIRVQDSWRGLGRRGAYRWSRSPG